MWVALLIATITLLSSVVSRNHDHCPVSSTIRFNASDSFHFYPVDLYGPPNVIDVETVMCKTDDATNNVTAIPYVAVHKCPTSAAFCPVSSVNVHDAVQRTKSPLIQSSICVLRRKLLNESEQINFYVSGGSVTLGVNADGCCDSSACKYDESEKNSDYVVCTWSYHLYRWMNETFPANISYVNFAGHGHSSDVMADSLRQKISSLHLQPFSSNDIIFVDHSVNDNEGGAPQSIAPGFENLIRHLYYYSKPHDWPTIIVLDADPKRHSVFQGKFNYSDVYQEIAAYYQIPVWSFRDAVLSNHSIIQQQQYSRFLTFAGNVFNGNHPPWHVHLFMADLYAGIMMHDMNEFCTHSTLANKLHLANLQLRNRTFTDLPPPLAASMAVTDTCENEVLSLDYESVARNVSIGEYEFFPAVGGWSLGLDKPGRPGGFIVDKNASEGASVVFALNITSAQFWDRRKEVQIIMQYLRSYDNGGVVTVKFCGNRIGNSPFKADGKLDGLWSDYQTHRVSLPDKWAPPSSKTSYRACKHFKGKRPQIEVEFEHHDGDLERGAQKFKILSVTACLV